MAQNGDFGIVGKLVIELEVSSPADKFYTIFKHQKDVPKAIPHLFTDGKVIEGDASRSGCIKEWNYVLVVHAEGKTISVTKKQHTTMKHRRCITVYSEEI
ncbi:major latex protein 15-like [Papaver somniferum]|uniref:major latex protein 15-like n=1 Tax=Papaver somniferum TaxID=3469 RepID=UPI000E6FAA82|nr:major latex protein 15-like [Papaver somniferum]